MSGLDEVEEWLRERTFLLQALKEATDQILQFYMKQPDRAVMEGNGEVQNLIDRYLAILDYKRKSTTPGIWVVLQMANIPRKLVKPTKDWEFARRAVAFLLNTHVNEILEEEFDKVSSQSVRTRSHEYLRVIQGGTMTMPRLVAQEA